MFSLRDALIPKPAAIKTFFRENPKVICKVLGHFKDLRREGADIFFGLSR
jgi:hypothetical protein